MEVFRCAGCGLTAYPPDAVPEDILPTLHWRRGTRHGLAAYAIGLTVFYLLAEYPADQFWTWWPAYLALAPALVLMMALDLSAPNRHAFVAAIWALHVWAGRALPDRVIVGRQALAAELALWAAMIVLIALTALVRGRLPWLDVRTPKQAAVLVAPAAVLAGLALWIGYGTGPAGQVYFGTELIEVHGVTRIRQPQRFFRSGDTVAWLAYLRRPAGAQVKVHIWYEGMLQYGSAGSAQIELEQAGALRLGDSGLVLPPDADSGWYLLSLTDPGGDTLAQGGVYVLRSSVTPPP